MLIDQLSRLGDKIARPPDCYSGVDSVLLSSLMQLVEPLRLVTSWWPVEGVRQRRPSPQTERISEFDERTGVVARCLVYSCLLDASLEHVEVELADGQVEPIPALHRPNGVGAQRLAQNAPRSRTTSSAKYGRQPSTERGKHIGGHHAAAYPTTNADRNDWSRGGRRDGAAANLQWTKTPNNIEPESSFNLPGRQNSRETLRRASRPRRSDQRLVPTPRSGIS